MIKVNPLILFDIDSTLVTKSKGIVAQAPDQESLNTVLREYFSNPSIDYSDEIQPGLTDWIISERALARHLPRTEIGRKDWNCITQRVAKLFRNLVTQATVKTSEYLLLPGVKELLDLLQAKGFTLGLVTGNLKCFGNWKLEQVSIASYFSMGAFGEDAKERVDILRHALKNACVSRPDDVVVVGDSLYDLQGAKAMGTRFLGVGTTGLTKEDIVLERSDPLTTMWVKELTQKTTILKFLLGLNG